MITSQWLPLWPMISFYNKSNEINTQVHLLAQPLPLFIWHPPQYHGQEMTVTLSLSSSKTSPCKQLTSALATTCPVPGHMLTESHMQLNCIGRKKAWSFSISITHQWIHSPTWCSQTKAQVITGEKRLSLFADDFTVHDTAREGSLWCPLDWTVMLRVHWVKDSLAAGKLGIWVWICEGAPGRGQDVN